MDTNILAIAEPDWFGVRRAMTTYTSHVVSPGDARYAIETLKPRIVLFGCYKPEWKPTLIHARLHGCMCICAWFASYTLNEFDKINRDWLHAAFDAYRAGLFSRFAFAHRGLAHAWHALGYRADYLPLTVSTKMPTATKLNGVHIGIFGSAQPWKNMECQILAAHLADSTATIHVQHTPSRSSVARMMNIPCVVHESYMEDTAYYALLGSMTMNMCVSFSETYSYLTAESLLMGTPVLASHLTPIMQELHTEHPLVVCRTTSIDDPMKLAADIRHLISVGPKLRALCIDYMSDYNTRELNAVTQLIAQWHQSLSTL